jgi:hypothetical protein
MKTNKTLESYGFDESHLITVIKGGNSLIYKCRTSAGSYVGIKEYLGEYRRCVRSMEREVDSLNFLHENKFAFVTRLISFNRSTPSICYEWIKGETPEINSLVKNQIISALVNLNSLYELNPNFPPAVDAISNTRELRKQIAKRLPDAKIYLKKHPATFKALKRAAWNKKNQFGDDEIPINTFSFSDIGVHNMVMNSSSEVYFLDFEFFGADSKIKMLCDLFAHPKNIFSKDEILILARKLFVTDYEYNCIIKILPDIAFKWALITSRRISNKIFVNKKNSVYPYLNQINQFLDYSMYLGEIKTFDEILTFLEYKKMQQYGGELQS